MFAEPGNWVDVGVINLKTKAKRTVIQKVPSWYF
jgi:hypothetical protein